MAETNYYFIGALDTKELASDEGDLMEDTFRPSLFQRIDSCSSLEDQFIYEQSIPQINISGMTRKEDRDAWDVSMLYSIEHEKNQELDLQLKNTEEKVKIAQRKERKITELVKDTQGKLKVSEEQHAIEAEYLKGKIEQLLKKLEDFEGKIMSLEEKNNVLGKENLLKDKKIVWLENEIFAKELRLKNLNELEKEVGLLRCYKENHDILKEKIGVLDEQMQGLKKTNRDLQGENSKALRSFELDLCNAMQEKEKAERKCELLKLISEKHEDEMKKLEGVIRKLENEVDIAKNKLKVLESANELPTKQSPLKSSQRVLGSVMNILRTNDEFEVMPKIEELLTIKSQSKFIAKLAGLIKDCSPVGTFPANPTTTQMWKFIRKVMEGYVDLRKKNAQLLQTHQLLKEKNSLEAVKELLNESV